MTVGRGWEYGGLAVTRRSLSGGQYTVLEFPLPRIPDELLHSIVFLYPSAEAAQQGTPAGGTGFFVDIVSQVSRKTYRYVVTNSHVVHQGGRFLRINLKDGGTDVVEIPMASWVDHPEGDDVSAAAMLESDPHWAISALKWENLVGDIPTWRDRVAELNLGVGDEVFMLGRFVAHDGVERNQPLARFGNIAMMPGELVLDGRQFHVEAFLVEMRSLSGFSGSPVFVYMGPGTYRGNKKMMPFYSETIGLIGIDSGHKLSTSHVLDSSTRTPVAGWIVPQNTGIAIVAPAWKIREVLDEERFMKQRKETDKAWVEKYGHQQASSDLATDEGQDAESDFLDILRK